MKNTKLIAIVIVAYILQTMVISELRIFGISPNLFLIVVCGLSFLFGSTVGGISGIALGFLQDMNIGRTIGLNGFIYMYIGIMMGQFNRRFFKDNYIVCLFFIVFSTVIYESIVYVFASFAYLQPFSFGNFMFKLLIISLVNAVASIIVYPILLKINIDVESHRKIFGR